ncbi:YidC/Oxa1 family membrane protein insertase [Candidatus Saccharibacteria bacterium]|nr:YidC/Oxa1 family membrane protein insertase [Candidatus Saccharibacteria bacterium]
MGFFDTVIVQPIFNLLVAIYSFVPGSDFGLSIILFTILVRLLLWPLIKAQFHQTKAMRRMQPELKKLSAKYKNDRQARGFAMMELYKKHDIKPFRSILMLLIQLPIFIAIYRVVQIFTTELDQVQRYTYSFLESLPQVAAIIENPAGFNEELFGIVDLTKQAISADGFTTTSLALLLIALAAAILQYFLAKQTMPTTDTTRRLRDVMAEAAEGKEADQMEINAIVMRKMMVFLPFMLFFIMINLPGALALYMLVSNAVAYIQQRIVLGGDVEEMEAIANEPTAKNKAKKAKEAMVVASPGVTRVRAKVNPPSAKRKSGSSKSTPKES